MLDNVFFLNLILSNVEKKSMRILSRIVLVSSIVFSLCILANCVFGRYGLLDIKRVNDNISEIKSNTVVLKDISASLSSMRNDYASDDFYLLEARKLSMYTSDDVVVQIDGYVKKGLSEEYGSFRTLLKPSGFSFFKMIYSVAGVVASFSFLLFVALGGGTVRHERKTDHFRTVRAHRSGSR